MTEIYKEFEQMYEENFSNFYRLVCRLTGNKQDAEDVLQEAFLNAYKSLPSFLGRSSLNTWMYKITVNTSLKYLKKRREVISEEKAFLNTGTEEPYKKIPVAGSTPETDVIADDIRELCLQMFLECMPRKLRITFILRVLLELSVKEIAEIMDISESSIKVSVYRAKKLMEENMEGRCSLINSKNSCRCGIWANYIIESGKTELLRKYKPISPSKRNNTAVLISELSFLNKLSLLYADKKIHIPHEAFVNRMKNLITEGVLQIFS